MKIRNLLPLIIIPVALVGCNNKNNKGSKDRTEPNKVTLEMSGIANTAKSEPYSIEFEYDFNYFNHSASVFDNNLKLLSFASACAGSTEQIATKFFNDMTFDDHYAHGYETTSEDSIGYFFAHKSFEDYDLFAVTIRGFDYKEEWANNLRVGLEGDHEGFSLRGAEVYLDLERYVNTAKQNSESPAKIWITGYSRAGAIANVLAHKLLSQGSDIVAEDNLFAYTFEAPTTLDAQTAPAYTNVFNFVNSRDLVTRIPPQEYGLKRCGIDIDIYNSNVDTWLTQFDPDIVMPEFHAKGTTYANDYQFLNWFIAQLMSEPSDEAYAPYTLETRESYVATFQDNLGYLMGFYFSLTSAQTEAIMNDFSETDGLTIFMSLYTENGLYDLLKGILDNHEISYDATKLNAALEVLRLYLISHATILGSLIDISSQSLNQNTIDNIKRVIFMHYPEVTYVLIKNQQFTF